MRVTVTLAAITTAAAVVVGLAAADVVRADIFQVSDGRRIEGAVVSESADEVVILSDEHGELTLATSEITKRRKSTPPETGYLRQRSRSPDTADGHFKLAKFCAKRGMKNLAQAEIERTIELDPDHAGARKALGQVQRDGEWISQEEDMLARGYVRFCEQWVAPDKLDRARRKRLIAVDLHVGFPSDESEEALREFADTVEQTSELLWKLTDRQMYVATVTVSDKLKGGNVQIRPKAEITKVWPDGKEHVGWCSKGSDIVTERDVQSYTLAHSVLHLVGYLDDEYATGGNEVCESCIMGGTGSELCSADTHRADGQQNCKARLAARFPVKFPNPDATGDLPETVVTIKDR